MVKLEKLSTRSRTTEVDAVSIRIIIEYENEDWSSDTHLTGIFGKLKPESEKLTSAINRVKIESTLEEKDEVRDNKLQAIYYLVKGFLHHPDFIIKDSAEKIDKIFEHYGLKITKESYATETSLVNSLLMELDNADLQPVIEALPGLGQVITELKAAQTDFERTRVEYEKILGLELKEANATKLKKVVLEIINDQLVIYLRAMVQVDEAKYGVFTTTVSRIIDDNNEEVNRRRKHKEPVIE